MLHVFGQKVGNADRQISLGKIKLMYSDELYLIKLQKILIIITIYSVNSNLQLICQGLYRKNVSIMKKLNYVTVKLPVKSKAPARPRGELKSPKINSMIPAC